VARFRRALALGGSRPLPEIYAAAGAELIFDAARMRELIELVESELAMVDAA
jgi:oligoendopeptidase F